MFTAMKLFTKEAVCSIGIVLSFLCVSCTDNSVKISDVVVFVDPASDSIPVIYTGDKQRYKLDISTIHDYVSKFSVKSFDIYQGNIVLLDSICEKKLKSFTHNYVYTAPEIDREEIVVELNFLVEDNNGNTAENIRYLKVKNKYVSLNELDGIVLYGSDTDLPNALSLECMSQPFNLKYTTDSLSADIYVESNELFDKINLRSLTDLKFVRNNSFNYAKTSANQIQTVYESSIRSDIVLNLCINDVILVGHKETAKGVLYVKNIILQNDVLGNNACLQLGFKGLSTFD